jgi:hypothetical protein
LYRLSVSEHAERFLLKGALLFSLRYDIHIGQPGMEHMLGTGFDQTLKFKDGIYCYRRERD